MSEEEKKAIEVLKEWLCKTHSKFCKVGAVGIPNIEFFATETVLNLIEKQQAEIKEYKTLFKRQKQLEQEKENLIKQGWLNE